MSVATDPLHRDALTVLQPGFIGTTPPDWVRRQLAAGLGAVGLFGRNVRNPEQLAALTAVLRGENPEVLIAIDEEGGDVARLEVGVPHSAPIGALYIATHGALRVCGMAAVEVLTDPSGNTVLSEA